MVKPVSKPALKLEMMLFTLKNCRWPFINIILLSVLVFHSSESHAVPPDPRVYGVREADGQYDMAWPILEMRESPAVRSPGSALGTQEIIVILMEFQDVTHDPAYDSTYFHDLFFSESNPLSMYSYYNEVSYGQTSISGTIIGWYRSNRSMVYYGADRGGIDNANGPIYELAREAVKLADTDVDFSQYDKNHDGYVDHIIVVHAGPGQESDGSDAIWSHHWAIRPGEQVDSVYALDYSMVAESSPMGTTAHEFGHDLGLPDLYDIDRSSEGIGAWGIMAYGAWQEGGDVPAHFCAWSRVFLGWVESREVTIDETGVILNCVEHSNLDTIISIPLTSDEYFLLENRYKTGFDQYLPGEGVLIWHIDDSVGSIDLNNVNNNEDHKRVDLEEADGRDDLDSRMNFGDYTDPYYLNAEGFTPFTTPNSRPYSGLSSHVNVVNISGSGSTMTFDILFPNSAPVADAGGPYIGGVNIELTLNGSSSFDPEGDSLEYRWDFDDSDGIQVDSIDATPTYSYTVTGTHTVTLIVNDGEADSDPSTTTAEIKAVQEMTLHLVPGWNLISLHLQPVNTDRASVMSAVEGRYSSIWAYVAAIGEWQRYIVDGPSFLNNLDEMEAGIGYWIMMDQPGTLIISGISPVTALSLKAGWNLVGYNSQTPMSIEEYSSSVEDKPNSIWTYDSEAEEWLRHDMNGPDFLNNLEFIERGRGYWIDAKVDHIWDVEGGIVR